MTFERLTDQQLRQAYDRQERWLTRNMQDELSRMSNMQDMAAEIERRTTVAADPRDPHPTRTDIFRDHNCWKCRNGELPCVSRDSVCEYPHARND